MVRMICGTFVLSPRPTATKARGNARHMYITNRTEILNQCDVIQFGGVAHHSRRSRYMLVGTPFNFCDQSSASEANGDLISRSNLVGGADDPAR